ncbi:MAG TPA: hypothetical protein DCY13_22895 [Verrucomicrobiales bacterium]|nr:hypothetical protein [Verrucomicrobiales bacterium]
MSMDELRSSVARLSEQQQNELIAYVIHLRHQRDAAARRELASRLDRQDPKDWASLDSLKESWKD